MDYINMHYETLYEVGTIRHLIQEGVDLNATLPVEQRGEIAMTLLQGASADGKLESVRLLLDNGVDVNKVDEDGCSALRYATFNGYMEIARLLLEHGAILESMSNDEAGYTSLHIACRDQKEEMIVFLLQQGADPHLPNRHGITPRQLVRSYHLREVIDSNTLQDVKEPGCE